MKYIVGSLVVKNVNTCNLNCSYCYVFNSGDEHYMDIPVKMSEQIYEQMLMKIKNHCVIHHLKYFTIIFHGGEPLILGIEYYKKFLLTASKIFIDSNIKLNYLMQSNATLMTEEWAIFLTESEIHVGFSLDGYESVHDKNRKYCNNGNGSYKDVIKGLKIYERYAPINILSVVNPESDVNLFYKTIKLIGCEYVSILLRDCHHSNKSKNKIDISSTLIWLIKLFDLWFEDNNKNKLKILSPFSDIINLILGIEKAGNDAYGETLNSSLLVLTNGEIQVTGVEKSSRKSKAFFVQKNSIGTVFTKKIFRDYYNLHQDSVLCNQCKKCLIKGICGGGRYSHRFSVENKFNNPTVYCELMRNLILHIQNKIVDILPKDLKEKTNLNKLKYEDIVTNQ